MPLDFDRAEVAAGEPVRFTFTVDASLVGHRLKLVSGTTLGPTRLDGALVPLGGATRLRASFDVAGTETTLEFDSRSGFPGRTFLLLFVTTIGDTVTSTSNVVSVQGDGTRVRLKNVPVPAGYGWVPGDLDAEHTFYSVAFANESRGFAGGPSSTLWVTEDAGRTWLPQPIDDVVRATIRDVEFADEMNGFAIGAFFTGLVWKTSDGGRTWTRRSVNVVPFSVDFVDPLNGWVAGLPSPFGTGGPIARTTDGGATWRVQASDLQAEIRSIKFVDKYHGVAAGRNGLVLFTSDGGTTWVRKSLPAAHAGAYLMAADLVAGGTTATVSGFDSVVLRTSDGGDSWVAQRVPAGRTYYSVRFTSALRGWLVGSGGSILWTFDGGETWLPFDSSPNAVSGTFHDVFALDRDSIWTIGNDGQVRAFAPVAEN